MKIILKEKLNKINKFDQIINVKNGYAKNYLIPKNKAIFASPKNIKLFYKNKINNDLKIKKKIENITILIGVNTKNNEYTYNNINNSTLYKLLKKMNIKVKQNQIKLKILINKIGQYNFEISNNKNRTDISLNLILIKTNL